MHLIKHYCCCDLLTATSLTGIIALVAYVIAIVLEIWWMILDKTEFPAGGYLLLFGHFLILILSGFLLLSTAKKEKIWLLYWSITVGTWWIPEIALATYMSLHHWGLHTPQGTTELILCILRALFNLGGLLAVVSLYLEWREEKIMLRRLTDFNRRNPSSGDITSNVNVNKNPTELRIVDLPLAAVENLVANKIRRNSTPNRTIRNQHPDVQFISSYEKLAKGVTNNEFSAAAFLKHQEKCERNQSDLLKARSMLDLQIRKHDYWRGPPTSPYSSPDQDNSELYTMSLDRRRMNVRHTNVINNNNNPFIDYLTFPRYPPNTPVITNLHRHYFNSTSETSINSQKSENKYKDVEL